LTGWISEVKKAIKDEIEIAIPEAFVSRDWRDEIMHMRVIEGNLPFIAFRVSPVNLWDVYDRNLGETSDGSIADYHIQIHVFHSNCAEDCVDSIILDSSCEKAKHAQHVADRVVSRFLKNPDNVGFDVDTLSTRESEPRGGAHRISRVIIEGRIQVKRID